MWGGRVPPMEPSRAQAHKAPLLGIPKRLGGPTGRGISLTPPPLGCP